LANRRADGALQVAVISSRMMSGENRTVGPMQSAAASHVRTSATSSSSDRTHDNYPHAAVAIAFTHAAPKHRPPLVCAGKPIIRLSNAVCDEYFITRLWAKEPNRSC
jgi:hypothetical protein